MCSHLGMDVDIDRNWFLTIVTYGTWLPGDERGFVSHHRPSGQQRIIHNVPGTPRDCDLPHLQRYARSIMTGEPLQLNVKQAHALWAQFSETAGFRRWRLWALSVMAKHLHAVVGVSGDPSPSKILGDLKSYGSRALNRGWGKPANGTWWADGGSKQKLATEASLWRAIRYTIEQDSPLLVWSLPIPELHLPGGFYP